MIRKLAVAFLLVMLLSAAAAAQGKEEDVKLTPVKVQVVFSEWEAEKKVASFPYTILVSATDNIRRSDASKIRVGVRIPITTQGKDGPTTVYLDVGSNIDARGAVQADGKVQLDLSLRRSFIYAPQGPKSAAEFPVTGNPNPIFRNFDAELRLVFKDGETIQTHMATDPVSGRVLKVDVTVNIVK